MTAEYGRTFMLQLYCCIFLVAMAQRKCSHCKQIAFCVVIYSVRDAEPWDSVYENAVQSRIQSF